MLEAASLLHAYQNYTPAPLEWPTQCFSTDPTKWHDVRSVTKQIRKDLQMARPTQCRKRTQDNLQMARPSQG